MSERSSKLADVAATAKVRSDDGATGRAGSQSRTARNAFRYAALVAGIALLAVIFGSVGWRAIEDNLARVGAWFPVLLILYVIPQLAFALGWWVLFEPRLPASELPALFGVYLAGDSANYLAPGNVAGEPLKVHLLRDRAGGGPTLASVTIHKHADMLAQWLFVAAGVGVALWRFPLPAVARAAALVGVAGLGALLLLVSWALRRGTYSPIVRRLSKWKPLATRLERLRAPAEAVDGRIRTFYAEHRGRFAAATAWCLLGWCGGFLETYLVLRLLVPGAGWATALAVEALAMALNNMLLFIPARLGSAEGVRVAVFVVLGLTAAQGAAYGLVRRGRELLWTIPGLAVLIKRHALDEPPFSQPELAADAEEERAS